MGSDIWEKWGSGKPLERVEHLRDEIEHLKENKREEPHFSHMWAPALALCFPISQHLIQQLKKKVKTPFLPHVGARSHSVFSHIPGTYFFFSSTCCSCFGRLSLISDLAPSPTSWKNVMSRSFLKNTD